MMIINKKHVKLSINDDSYVIFSLKTTSSLSVSVQIQSVRVQVLLAADTFWSCVTFTSFDYLAKIQFRRRMNIFFSQTSAILDREIKALCGSESHSKAHTGNWRHSDMQ